MSSKVYLENSQSPLPAADLADAVRQLRPHPTPPDQNIDPEAVALGFVYSDTHGRKPWNAFL